MKFNNSLLLGHNKLLTGLLFINLFSCVSIPKGVEPVSNFDKQKYLGTWYEIARLDFKFEKGLDHVTANYSLRSDGLIKVVNTGYDTARRKWRTSVGKAKSAGPEGEGRLKVSFFGPFYAGYNIIALDSDYRNALVAGNNTSYLWILSREKEMPAAIKDRYLMLAKRSGYDTAKFVWTKQD